MKKRIVCFGDSNTWGYNGVDGSRYSDEDRWTGVLKKLLGEEYVVIEEGQNARTTVFDDPIQQHKNGLKYLLPCLESHMPIDLLIIMLGSNDAKERFGCNAYNIARGASNLAIAAKNSGCGRNGGAPQVLLVSPILIEKNYLEIEELSQNFGLYAHEKSLEFARWFSHWADVTGCDFFDAAAVAQADVATDGVHMNIENHNKLGQSLAKHILKIYGQGC